MLQKTALIIRKWQYGFKVLYSITRYKNSLKSFSEISFSWYETKGNMVARQSIDFYFGIRIQAALSQIRGCLFSGQEGWGDREWLETS
jgi:hypothetical protein